MKPNCGIYCLSIGLVIFSACAGGNKKIVFLPETPPEQPPPHETWQILESQNGSVNAAIPEWVSRFLNGGIQETESMGIYQDNYIFIAMNHGNNFNALRQWAAGFTAARDLSRLVAVRVENRMLGAAYLYPDDEYGDFFEILVKNSSDAEYPDALVREKFWLKRRISEGMVMERRQDRYEFFVLISIDKIKMQTMIKELMDAIKTTPTRDQAASINRLKQNFFEGF